MTRAPLSIATGAMRTPVLIAFMLTAPAGLGAMTLLAFAVPFLTSTGVDDRAVALLLLIHGATCPAGNIIDGRLADRGLGRALALTTSTAALALVVAGLIGGSSVGAVAGLAPVGLACFSTFAP
ncbi:hypothetical protein [Streptomyces sp. NPDC057496]|uniref:hypothetical protein n=1 Tax=Streptomyces sp. NPDC057496 TaxID=3346149 RepID=UPI00367C5814